MYSIVCIHNCNTDKNIAAFLTCGFTGILKGWWDNYLTFEQKNEILNVVELKSNQHREDIVYTLIITILNHFTGGITN